ncbi:alpha/beta hydrolase [Nonomuraea typhae]|uniref:Alpha/beta hydrolase n=1 Tax=Nonomuraea typhae TaxID=2603600 RepID=A0ABW7YLZ7_9ACTN
MIIRVVTALVLSVPPFVPLPAAAAVACPVPVPAHTACGFLEVPERRDAPGRTIKVGYAVHRSADPARKPDPVVYMGGGPASSSLQLTGFLSQMFPGRDIVTIEQRGGKYSEPRLTCPETAGAMLERLRRPEAGAAAVAEGAVKCRARLAERGVDLRGYTTREIVADVVELRKKLGYATWNLFGVSYSTRVMTDVAAADPQGVRAVLLDSYLPESVDWYGDADRNLEDTVAALGVKDRFEAMLARYNRAPALVPTTDPLLGEPFTARMSGDDIATVLAEALHEAEVVAAAPAMIDALAGGRTEVLRPLADQVGAALTSHEFGLYHAVQCQDEAKFPEKSRLFTVTNDRAVCAAWKLPTTPPAQSESRVKAPVLVAGGQFDPTTPPRTQKPAAAKLPDAHYVEFAGVGHAVFLAMATPCGRQTMIAFLDDPAAWTQPCVPGRAGLERLEPGSLIVTGAPYQLLLAPWLAVPLAAFVLVALVQLVGGGLRGRALSAFAGLTGLAAAGLTAQSVYGLSGANESALAVGVPKDVEMYGWLAVGAVALTVAAAVWAVRARPARRPWPHLVALATGGGFLIWWFAWFL